METADAYHSCTQRWLDGVVGEWVVGGITRAIKRLKINLINGFNDSAAMSALPSVGCST